MCSIFMQLLLSSIVMSSWPQVLSSVVQHGLGWPHPGRVSAPLIAKACWGLNVGCFEVAISWLKSSRTAVVGRERQVIWLGNLRLALILV